MGKRPQTQDVLPGMPDMSQAAVDGVPAAPASQETPRADAAPRLKPVNRSQMLFRTVDVDRLVDEDHPARAIWAFASRLNLEAFYAPIKAVEGVAGRETWDPLLLIGLWLYAYSRGIGSAREVARRCEYDPAFQWLTGMQEVNHHTLSDFRVDHQAALDDLFVQALGLLSAEGLITLERVMHDGTKVKASAGSDSFRRERRIREHLEEARQQVAAMGDPRQDPGPRRRAAQERAQRERQERLEEALEELEKIRQAKSGDEARNEARASLTDPEARSMKQPDGGYGPCYNLQLSTDAAQGVIVGLGVSQSASDYGELAGAVERVEENLGRKPAQVVADGGFTSRENILKMDEKGVDLVGSLDEHDGQSAGQMKRRGVAEEFYPQAFRYDAQHDGYRCPAGHVLRHEGQEKRIGVVHHRYRADRRTCAACRWKDRCCPGNPAKGRAITRAVESPAVRAFIDKMKTEAAQAVYRLRGAVAEFPNAWIKAKIGLRQFHVRGLPKVLCEALWACLTYNIQQWIRLRWRRPQATTAD
jgi:transposase